MLDLCILSGLCTSKMFVCNNVPLLVGVELANTHQQLVAKQTSFRIYGDEMLDLVYGNCVIV